MNGSFIAERKPLGYEQLTVSTTAVALTVPAGASRALVRVAAQPIRYRDDGVAPTATVGFPQAANNEFQLVGKSLHSARFIRSGGTNASIDVLYYGA